MRTLNLEQIRNSFLHSALWTEELDMKNIEDFAPSAIALADKVIARFLKDAPEKDLNVYIEHFESAGAIGAEDPIGFDIWLSINGHGSGFFDHRLGGSEDVLHDVCREIGVGEDRIVINQVWVSEIGTVFIE